MRCEHAVLLVIVILSASEYKWCANIICIVMVIVSRLLKMNSLVNQFAACHNGKEKLYDI